MSEFGPNPEDLSSEENKINLRPSEFNIRYKGLTRNLFDSEEIYCVDRGVIALFLSAEASEWIEGITNPVIDFSFYPDTTTLIPTNSSAIKFKNSDIPVEDLGGSNSQVNIIKIGNKGVVSNSYNKMYLPIQGIVAFNYDEDGYLYILKKSKPYTWDSEIVEKWYFKTNPREAYKNESNSAIESSTNFPQGSFSFDDQSNPSFETNAFFGEKGSIERKGEYLLICFSGEKNKGVYVFRKNVTTQEYGLPTQILITDDGTYPMDARFDPKTFSNNDYGDIYVALSDLKRSQSGTESVSRFEKIKPDGTVDWVWGEETEDITVKFSIGMNSIRPFTTGDYDTVIVST
jgi:hypothetical protein